MPTNKMRYGLFDPCHYPKQYFKPGDKVLCLYDHRHGFFSGVKLEAGKVYKVEMCAQNGVDVRVVGSPFNWNQNRFVHFVDQRNKQSSSLAHSVLVE